MKNHTFPFVFTLVLHFLCHNQAYCQTNPSTSKNFFEVRDEILKELEKAKNEGQFNEGPKWKDSYMAKFKRWEHFMLSRVGPTGEFFRPDAAYNAYTNYYSNHTQNKSPFGSSWEAIGPFSDQSNFTQTEKVGVGRINCIAQHPQDSNTLFVGTFCGGIWKTTDAGLSWTCLDNNMPSMSFTDIAINPIHPDTIYAATGDALANRWGRDYRHSHYSIGIIMSGDGGNTWTQTGFNYQQIEEQNINRIVIDPVQTNNLLVACDQGLYRSTDAGHTWTQLDNTKAYDIQINPLDPSKYYAIVQEGRKLKRSYDGGATFTITNASNLIGSGISRVRVSPADTSKIYVVRGTGILMKSSNAGKNFQGVANVGISFEHQMNWDKALALSPVDTNVMLIGLVSLIKSMDKGATFAIIDSMHSYTHGVHVDFHDLQFSLFNTNTIYATNDGGVYVSHDIGETWTSLNNGLNITEYYKIGSSFLNPDLILGGSQDNSSHLFNGEHWMRVLGSDGMYCSFDKADENIAYASAQDGAIFRSNDGGILFSKSIVPPGFTGDWVTPHLANPLHTSTLFLGGKRMYASYNKGDSWQTISQIFDNNLFITSIAQSPADTLTLYAATYRNLYVTHDHGLNWSNITSGLPAASASIMDVKTSDHDANTVYVIFAGFVSGEKVYKTIDGGLTWTNITGTLPNVSFNTIAIQNNSNKDMYAGCDFGVFYKNDTMPDWVAYNSNLPGIIVADLEINYRNSRLYAGTHGRGIYAVDLVTPVAPITNDVAIAKITSPVINDYCDSLTTPLTVVVKNYGSDTLYNATINYIIDNDAVQSVAWAGVLPPFQSVMDTIATLTLYGGLHHFEVFTSDPNHTVDAYALNDGQASAITVGAAIASFPFAEGFESEAFPPTDWIQTGGIWSPETGVGAHNNSTRSAVAKFFDVERGTDYLSSMRVDLTNVAETPFLAFSHAYAMYSAMFLDTLIISVSSNCGDSWETLYEKSAQDLTTVSNFITTSYVPAADEWVTTYIDLSAYMGQEIKVRFEAHAGYSNNLYIDDIHILNEPVGVAEINKNNISVYPNPTQGTLNIADPDEVVQNIQIYDSTGKLVYNSSTKQVHEPIDMSAYQQNMYFIKMQTVKGMVTKKVVVVE